MYLVLDTWAGRRYHKVEVIGEAGKKARIRIVAAGGVTLPGRRYVPCGGVVLVPKTAVRELEGERSGQPIHEPFMTGDESAPGLS